MHKRNRHRLGKLQIRRFILRSLLVSGFIIAPLSGCRQASIDDIIAESLNVAHIGNRANWGKVLKNLRTCIKAGVQSPDLTNFYILSLYYSGNHKKALATAQRALAERPDDFLRNYLAGKIQIELESYTEALPHLLYCAESRPDHLDSKVLLAKAAMPSQPALAEAIYHELSETTAYSKSFLVYNGLAVACARQGKMLHASSHFSKALQLSKGHPLIHFNIAVFNDRWLNKPTIAATYYNNFVTAAANNYPNQLRSIPTQFMRAQ